MGKSFFYVSYNFNFHSFAFYNYTLHIQPISQSWTEGTGKDGDNPKNTNGCSFENRSNPIGGTTVPWATPGVSVLSVSQSEQSFTNQSPDVEVDVTKMVNMWLKGQEENYGMLINFSGSQETDETTFGHLKFFSRNTHTIFSPRLEVRWDDHLPCTGSNTGSLQALDMSGEADNFVYMRGLKQSYKPTETVKFRIGTRKRYIQKTFSTSFQTATGSYVAEGSGSYSIIDIASGETIIPFSAFTSMSCDSTSNYFIQWLNGFETDRIYKVLIKIKYDDGQEKIFDDNFEFRIKR